MSDVKVCLVAVLTLTAYISVFEPSVLVADEAVCKAPASFPIGPIVSNPLLERISKFHDLSDKAYLVDAQFFYQIRRSAKAPHVLNALAGESGMGMDGSLPTASETMMTLINILQNPSTAPATYKEFLDFISKQTGNLEKREKLLFLSMLGTKLKDGYNQSKPTSKTSLEKLYSNFRGGGKKGGVCRDIHLFLKEVAEELGFVDAGTHSGISARPRKGAINRDGAGHVIAHFKDPDTGKYYVINYAQIIDTGEKSLPKVIDISTRVLGPLTGTSYVESQDGNVHLYQPRVARWVAQSLENQASGTEHQAFTRIQASNDSHIIAHDVFSRKKDKGGVKGTVLSSRVEGTDGTYELSAVMFSGHTEKKEQLVGVFDEVTYASRYYTGLLHVSVPALSFDAAEDGRSVGRMNLFGGATLTGTARIDEVTGKLEMKGNLVDAGYQDTLKSLPNYTAPFHEFSAGLTHTQAKGPMSVEAKRTIEIGPTRTTETEIVPRTKADKISVIIDTSQSERKIYIVNESSVYLMRGFESLSAVAVTNKLKAVIGNDRLGNLTIVGDYSRMVANPKKDPFYETRDSYGGSAIYRKALNKMLEAGTEVSYRENEPYHMFEDKSDVRPDSNAAKRDFRGKVFMNVRW